MSVKTVWMKIKQDGDKCLWETKSSKGAIISRWCHKDEYPDKIDEVGKMIDEKREEDTKMEVDEPKKEVKREWKVEPSGVCQKCKEEVKYPPLKCKPCEETKEIKFDEWGKPFCNECKEFLHSKGATCECGNYVGAPGEVIDVTTQKNFDLDGIWKSQPKGVLHVTSKHEMPIPAQTNPDISKDHAINEWVLNHLPLVQDQKKELMTGLIEDQGLQSQALKFEAKEKREKKRELEKEGQKERLKKERLEIPKLKRHETRVGVKDSLSWKPKDKDDVGTSSV